MLERGNRYFCGLPLSCVRAVTDCFVCGKETLARQKREGQEVTKSNELLMVQQPTGILKVMGVATIFNFRDRKDVSDGESERDWVWQTTDRSQFKALSAVLSSD